MNKSTFARKLAKHTGLSQAKALEILDSVSSALSGEGIIVIELDAGNGVHRADAARGPAPPIPGGASGPS